MCLSCPPEPFPWTGAIDEIALADLLEAMGIEREVSITIDDEAIRGRDSNGCYDLRESFAADKHVIFMCSNLTVELANEVLVHELGHARQAEMCDFGFDGLMKMQNLYLDETWHELLELQADIAAQRFAHRFSVAVAEDVAVAA